MLDTAVTFYFLSLFDWLQGNGQEEEEEEEGDEVEGTKEQDPETEEEEKDEGNRKLKSSRRIRSSFLSQVDEILSHCAAGKEGGILYYAMCLVHLLLCTICCSPNSSASSLQRHDISSRERISRWILFARSCMCFGGCGERR